MVLNRAMGSTLPVYRSKRPVSIEVHSNLKIFGVASDPGGKVFPFFSFSFYVMPAGVPYIFVLMLIVTGRTSGCRPVDHRYWVTAVVTLSVYRILADKYYNRVHNTPS